MIQTTIRYQVFVSSTYEDLRIERQQVTQAILEMGSFPSGMELFPASDDSQWKLIQRVIEESDYYIVILGDRYGSVAGSGLSYTEMEYDFAIEIGIPVLGFVRRDISEIPKKFTEDDFAKRAKLEKFRAKVKSKSCVLFDSPAELGMAVMKSLVSESRINPQTGWVRANQARSSEDILREDHLRKEIMDLQGKIENLQRQLRDKSLLVDEIGREQLAQGDDEYLFRVRFRDSEKNVVAKEVPLTWNEIFGAIGPSMYGYIVRKAEPGYGEKRSKYPFESHIEDIIRFKIVDSVGDRKIHIDGGQVDGCILQFKELDLIEYQEERDEEDNVVFRGITLTPLGERELTLIRTEVRPKSTSQISCT